MNNYKALVLICGFFFLSSCAYVVHQHRDMAGEQSQWGYSQVYRMWVNGWLQKNISNRARNEYSPDVRHDGKKIVFLTGMNEIHIMNIEGNSVIAVPNALQDAGAPRWSRGETDYFILFSYPASFAQSSIYRIAPDGSGLTKITNPSPTQKDELADSIDDKHIVFVRYDSANNHDRDLYIKYIWDNRPEVRLTNTPNKSETLPVVSHDGKMLAYRVVSETNQDDQVHVARFNSPTSITVLYTIDLQSPADINISGIDFSRNDKELFISTQASDVAGNLINRKQEIFRVRLDGSYQRRLTNNADEDVYPSAIP